MNCSTPNRPEICGWSNYRWWNYDEWEREKETMGKWIKMSMISFASQYAVQTHSSLSSTHIYAIHVDWKCESFSLKLWLLHRNKIMGGKKVLNVESLSCLDLRVSFNIFSLKATERESMKFMTPSACSLHGNGKVLFIALHLRLCSSRP